MLLLARGDRFNANFFYHSGVDIDNSFFLKDGGDRILLVPRMNADYAKEKFQGDVKVYTKDPLKEMEKLCRGRKLEMDFRSISAHFYKKISSFSRPADVSEQLSRARIKKSPGELLLIKQAVRASKSLVEAGRHAFGKTEMEFASELYTKTSSKGFRPAFKPIVSSGKNTSFPHYDPNSDKISGMCLVDYGVSSRRYCADITRVFFQKSDPKKEKIYRKLQHILEQLVEHMPEFNTGGELAAYAEKLYRKEGLVFPPHSIGHGIGLEVHEMPSLSKLSKDPLEGATFALEPSVYYSGQFGLRYEEVVY
ncbi:MAG: Xaa-Pro peptidase family protein, partial [Candidatus ainarchaeum sp.]|nr:Xaa-Pro peptidase family protein [Candidatus ainarchaeum sp.]